MKTLTKITQLLVFAVVLAVTFTACSSVSNEVESLTEEDIELAAQIISASVADDESGIVSSMYDALSNTDEEGISYDEGHARNKSPRRRGGRGSEGNYTHTYDSTTGVHSISYTRSVENDRYSKSVSLNQEIIYTSIDGDFIARPKGERENIESISFAGTKTGEKSGTLRSSSFTKIDTMAISGIHSTSGTLLMDGTHRGFGDAEGTLSDSTTGSRSYEINITFENVSIDKDTVQAYGNLEQGVSGTLTYSVYMNKTINGVPEETLVEGTIDLEEDGTALLRFNKFPRVIRFSLVDGDEENTSRR